jgi:hypothetical protein
MIAFQRKFLKDSSALDHIEKNGNNSDDQKNVDHASGTIGKVSDCPQNKKNDGDDIK